MESNDLNTIIKTLLVVHGNVRSKALQESVASEGREPTSLPIWCRGRSGGALLSQGPLECPKSLIKCYQKKKKFIKWKLESGNTSLLKKPTKYTSFRDHSHNQMLPLQRSLPCFSSNNSTCPLSPLLSLPHGTKIVHCQLTCCKVEAPISVFPTKMSSLPFNYHTWNTVGAQ